MYVNLCMLMLCSAPSLPYRLPYVQVSIGYDILENRNSHWKLKKKANMGNFGRQGDTYTVVGRPNDLVTKATCPQWFLTCPGTSGGP